MTTLGSRNYIFGQKVTKMGSIIGHRIDYNEVETLRGQRHIPSKNNLSTPPPPGLNKTLFSLDTSWSIEAWKPQSTTGDQWVEVDVNQVKTITRVATQGRSSSYVMTYTVSHSKSALWEAYLENNAVKVRHHECDNSGTFHERPPQDTVTRAAETCSLFCTIAAKGVE